MSNNYLEFSEVLPRLTAEEEAWLKSQLEQVRVIDGVEYPVDAVPEELRGKDPDWLGCRAYRDMESYDADFGEEAGFAYSFSGDDCNEGWGRHLWLYTEGWGYVERVAHFVQKFLKKFRPDQCWLLTWATTCSKPRVGEFGGGAVFVTASEIKWQITDDFVEEQTKAFCEQSGVSRLVQLIEETGLADDALDEAVHETAAFRASAINNGGPAEQIKYLVEQLGAEEAERTLKTLIAFCKAWKKEPEKGGAV